MLSYFHVSDDYLMKYIHAGNLYFVIYVSDEDLLKYFYAGDVNVAYSGLASTDTDKSCPISNQEID